MREIAREEEEKGRKAWIRGNRIRIEGIWWKWEEKEDKLKEDTKKWSGKEDKNDRKREETGGAKGKNGKND